MTMIQLTSRQQLVYEFILKSKQVTNADIKAFLNDQHEVVSRVTIVRDLEHLLNTELVEKTAAGRSTCYKIKEHSQFLRYFDPNLYFEQSLESRQSLTTFNFDVFEQNVPLFTDSELKHLYELSDCYLSNVQSLSKKAYQKEIERLTIELSWKSSQIEGNTYSLLDTEALIKENRFSPVNSSFESQMILNHKKCIDTIFSQTDSFLSVTMRNIEELHKILVESLDVSLGYRSSLVRIVGSNFKPLDNQHQIKEAIEKMIHFVNSYDDPFHKAMLSILFISYIQPFMDGNKRCSRLLGNAILYSFGACPLSYRSVDSVEYKKALLIFYEQNSLLYFKQLFIEQYAFSVNTYFQ